MFIIPLKLATQYYLYIGKIYLSEYFSNGREMPVNTKLEYLRNGLDKTELKIFHVTARKKQ